MERTTRSGFSLGGLAAVAFLAMGAGAANAQEVPPSISVEAVWQKGSPAVHKAPGALVQIVRVVNGRVVHVVREGKADANGKILFNQLPVGMSVYIRVQYQGVWSELRGPFPNNRGDKRRQQVPVRLG